MDKASATYFDKAKFACRVAKERMYTRSLKIEFMRMRSPKRAPPVFRLEGSTEIMPTVLSGKSIIKRRTNSSTSDDLPAPPVPVIPKVTDLDVLAISLIFCNSAKCIS